MKIFRSVTLAGALVLLSATPLFAQGTRITFDDAIGIALRQNIQVRQATNNVALQGAAVQQQKLSFLPDFRANLSGSNSVGRSFNEGQLATRTSQSLSTGVSSSVTLFDGFRNVASLKSAQADEEASSQDLARAKQTAVFSVASNFLSLVAGQEQVRVQQQNLAALEAQRDQIDKFVKAGARPVSDLYQQEASVASAKASLVDAQSSLDLAKVDLIQTLQLDPGGEYDFVAPSVDDASAAGKTYNLDELLAKAYAKRVDLSADQARLDAANQDVRAASASRWPTISLSAGYNTSYNSATDIAFSDQLDQRRGGSLGIGVSIPIFDKGATSLATQRAQIQADNAKLAVESQKQSIALEVRKAYLDEKAAEAKLVAAKAQLAAAEQAVKALSERYRVGASTFVELTQAQASQNQAASALVNARYNLVFQQKLMSYYTGELDPAAGLAG